VRNEGLRGKFVEILLVMAGLTAGDDTSYSSLVASGDLFMRNADIKTFIVPHILKLYSEIEYGEGQFYEKFNVRIKINKVFDVLYSLAFGKLFYTILGQIFKVLWEIPHQRAVIFALASNQDEFAPFINALFSDVGHLLDSCLELLASIRTEELERENRVAWAAQPPQERERRDRTYQHEMQQATHLFQIGNSSLNLLCFVTKTLKAPFLHEDFIVRFAHSLGYYIDKLVGPSISDFNVSNKEKLKFKPRQMLADVSGVFLNLSTSQEFLNAVANDGRSYKPETFAKWVLTVPLLPCLPLGCPFAPCRL